MKILLQRHKYKLNALILLLPISFYNGWFSSYPSSWTAKQIGEFTVKPLPLDFNPPCVHHGTDNNSYAKDFMVLFRQGNVKNIRQAYLTIGPKAPFLSELQQSDAGLLHGSPRAQSAHAISPMAYGNNDKLWLIIQDWQMQELVVSWELPQEFQFIRLRQHL